MLAAGALLQGRYKIREPLSEGGMSIVYLAEDAVLGNRVAIKEMKVHFLSPQERVLAAGQFLKEARILASLEHPGLPRVSNFFEQDARHYLVMDYIAGDTLEGLLNQSGGRLPEDVVLRVAIGAARVLDYLHTLQPAVIFRDLKPSNIILARALHAGDDERARLRLIDFGISKIFDSTQGTHTIIKGAGTPGYAPPEQYGAQGRSRTDPRSDIYSLGATMYSLLTGQIPTEATDRWMNGEVLPPPRQLNDAVSSETEALILRMMELKPDLRPSSARDVLEQLSAILVSTGPAAAVPVEPAASSQKPARRFRSSLAGGAGDGGTDERMETFVTGAGDVAPAVPASAAASLSPPAPAVAAPAVPEPPAPAPAASAPAALPPQGPPAEAPSAQTELPTARAAAVSAFSPAPSAAGARSGNGAAPPPPPLASLPPLPVPSAPPPRPNAPANPTVRGQHVPRASSPVLPVLAVVAILGVAFALVSALSGRPLESVRAPVSSASPSPRVASSASPAAQAASPSAAPSPESPSTPLPTRIGIVVSPAGAKLWLDGRSVGEAEATLAWFEVTPGEHRVKASKEGYLSRTVRVQAVANSVATVSVTLVKEATLRITSVPSGATVAVDGAYAGKTPLTLRGLSQGAHRYKVSAAHAIAEMGTIDLKAGQDGNLQLRLEPDRPVEAPPPPRRETYTPPVYEPPAPVYRPPAPPVYRPEPRATSVDVPAPRATPR